MKSNLRHIGSVWLVFSVLDIKESRSGIARFSLFESLSTRVDRLICWWSLSLSWVLGVIFVVRDDFGYAEK